ncbi:alpha/beta hydrolase fold domain-containing protein [Aeromicrobium sp. Leaf350]|uniref:alpha/beta hydrolase fold domain-containing protein n=1 Tax=Aeromicrobium sp. Leaf350 TaxID=2876565 RepID=UPI001E4E9209|nr:alpha/beta hydrolase fold domain-containing protein [Aeromicrobium sp. Leaf350]
MKIIIVGGGIGGLTAAAALRHHGIDVLVLERADELTEIGAGVQVAANGTIVMRELGLEPALAKVATVPERYDYRDLATGELLYIAPLGATAADWYGAKMYNVHRADLVDILRDALPEECVRLGSAVAGVDHDAEGVTVRLASGELIRGDAVVGADGIHSVVRDLIVGPEEKQFANILMWRALIPRERLQGLDLPVAGNNWFGVQRNIISYWVREDLYSVLAAVPAPEVHRESWTDTSDTAELLRSFEGAEPKVRRMLEAIDSTFITGMYYRDPIPTWTQGRVTLLGDAAHAMVPYLAQGACQAMEDAWTLAVCLERHGSSGIAEALIEYERRRQPRTTRIQAGARFAVKMAHEPDEVSVRARNGRWKGMQRIDPLAQTSWEFAWGHDPVAAMDQPVGDVIGLSSAKEGVRMKRPESQRAFDLWRGAIGQEDIAAGHPGQRAAYDRFLRTQFPSPPDLDVTSIELHGVPTLRVAAPAVTDPGRTLLHFHGGAYVLGSAGSSLEYAGRLSASFDAECFTVDYRLAPEHPYPAAIDDAFAAYRGLLARGVDPGTIILSGESAGGGIALALAQSLDRAGLPAPAGVFAVCPFTDLTLSGPSVLRYSGEDPASHRDSLTVLGASYFQNHEPTDPMVSPLFGDLSGLPPLYLSAVRGEVLESDTTRFAERAKAAGADVTLELVDDSVHVYTLFPFLPEAATTLAAGSRWAAELAPAGLRVGQTRVGGR